MSRLTSKGQVTIPKRVREALGLEPGSRVEFGMADPGQAFLRPVEEGGAKKKKDDFDKRLEKARAHFKLGMTTDEWLDITRDRKRDPRR